MNVLMVHSPSKDDSKLLVGESGLDALSPSPSATRSTCTLVFVRSVFRRKLRRVGTPAEWRVLPGGRPFRLPNMLVELSLGCLSVPSVIIQTSNDDLKSY